MKKYLLVFSLGGTQQLPRFHAVVILLHGSLKKQHSAGKVALSQFLFALFQWILVVNERVFFFKVVLLKTDSFSFIAFLKLKKCIPWKDRNRN